MSTNKPRVLDVGQCDFDHDKPPGQVAHIIIRHPSAYGWAEVYSDGI